MKKTSKSKSKKTAKKIIHDDSQILYSKLLDYLNNQRDLIKEQLPELGKGRMARFKVRVQDLGRIAIPEAEREMYDIHKGDLIQVIAWKIKKPE